MFNLGRRVVNSSKVEAGSCQLECNSLTFSNLRDIFLASLGELPGSRISLIKIYNTGLTLLIPTLLIRILVKLVFQNICILFLQVVHINDVVQQFSY